MTRRARSAGTSARQADSERSERSPSRLFENLRGQLPRAHTMARFSSPGLTEPMPVPLEVYVRDDGAPPTAYRTPPSDLRPI